MDEEKAKMNHRLTGKGNHKFNKFATAFEDNLLLHSLFRCVIASFKIGGNTNPFGCSDQLNFLYQYSIVFVLENNHRN